MKRAAIIGANSYIARNMIAYAKMHFDLELALYDREFEHMDGVENYHKIDFFNGGELEQAIRNVDLIYFFVGKTGTLQGFDDIELFLHVNELSLLLLLNVYKKMSSKAKILFPSSRLVYRGSDDKVSECSENQFLTPYAIQKYACEQYLKMYNNLYDVKYCILRICVPYGTLVSPKISYGTLDFFLNQANTNHQINVFGEGKQLRTFTYIGDLCKVLCEAGLEERCTNDTFNIGGETLSVFQVAEKVASATNSKIILKPWTDEFYKIESGSTVFDSKKLDNILHLCYPMTVDSWLKEVLKQ